METAQTIIERPESRTSLWTADNFRVIEMPKNNAKTMNPIVPAILKNYLGTYLYCSLTVGFNNDLLD